METLKSASGSNGVTVGQLREWLASLPADRLIAMSSDGEGNDFHVLAEGDPSVRYNLANDGFVHECDDECKTYRQKEIDLIGDEAFNSEGYVDCEYTWGGPETSDSDVHVVMLWPAG